jgi:hypothetical protein
MSTKMNLPVSATLALLLAATTGCNSPSATPVENAARSASSTVPQDEESPPASSDIVPDDEDVRLNDEFVSPDANAAVVSDEEDTSAEQQTPADAVDPLADANSPTAVEVTFVPAETTNIFITGQQLAYAREIEKRNERVREKRQNAQAAADATAGTDAKLRTNAPAAAATSPPASDAPAIAAVATAAPQSAAASAAPASTPPAPPIDEKKILEDKSGQWATSASASSTYAQSTAPKAGYSPWQVTGAPNIDRYSDNPLSWTTKAGDSKDPEWLEVGFARPVHATSIRIRQNAAPGVISRIELIDDARIAHTIWEGTDDTPYAKNTIGWLVKDLPRTTYLVTGARITLMTARVWGWNEIDAVQLVGEP